MTAPSRGGWPARDVHKACGASAARTFRPRTVPGAEGRGAPTGCGRGGPAARTSRPPARAGLGDREVPTVRGSRDMGRPP
eukprot:5745726-Pyramimonas_sp.AAC.1